MLFELYQIQKQQALIKNIEQSRQKTYNNLIKTSSKNHNGKKSLNQTFESILKQSALLIHILRQIQQNVKHKILLPSILSTNDINRLLYNRSGLPDWFQHVFQNQYKKQKANLQALSLKIYKLHGLSEMNAQLVKEHWNLQVLWQRYESLSEKQLVNIDIVKQMQSFKCLYQNCKDSHKKFLEVVVKKVLLYLQSMVQSTQMYSNKIKTSISVKSQEYGIPLLNYSKQNTKLKDYNYKSIASHGVPNKIFQNQRCENRVLDQTSKTLIRVKSSPILQELKSRQKVNNQYFFRKANQTTIVHQNSLSNNLQTLTFSKSQKSKFKRPNPYNNILENYVVEKDQQKSVRSDKFYADSCQKLRRLKSTSNLYVASSNINNHCRSNLSNNKQNIDNYLPINPKVNTNYDINNVRQQQKCYHHCPHHDRFLNNHCSKHCEQHCSHEKTFSKAFGLNLNQMNNQFYQSRNKTQHVFNQTARQTGSIYNEYSGRFNNLRGNEILNTRKQGNFAENRGYLRNSHQKHLSQDRNNSFYKSPLKQKVNYHLNKNLMNNKKVSILSNQRQFDISSNYSKKYIGRQIPSQYYMY